MGLDDAQVINEFKATDTRGPANDRVSVLFHVPGFRMGQEVSSWLPICGGVAVLNDHAPRDAVGEPARVYSPEEIAERLGGITVKSLGELIRNGGLETTTLGYAEPSRRGGPRRRVWGMTDIQLGALLALRRHGRHGQEAG